MNKKSKQTKPATYSYIIDLNERGMFTAHVENKNGNEILGITNDDNEDNENGQLWLIEDGYMKHITDLVGLKDYLLNTVQIVNPDDKIVMVGGER